jgi:hypothetical protein
VTLYKGDYCACLDHQHDENQITTEASVVTILCHMVVGFTFNYIIAVSLLVEEAGVPGENH